MILTSSKSVPRATHARFTPVAIARLIAPILLALTLALILPACSPPAPPLPPVALMQHQAEAIEIAAALANSDIPTPRISFIAGNPRHAWAVYVPSPFVDPARIALAELGLPRASAGPALKPDWIAQLFPTLPTPGLLSPASLQQLEQQLILIDGVTAAHAHLPPSPSSPTPSPSITITLRALNTADTAAINAAAAALATNFLPGTSTRITIYNARLVSPAAKAAVAALSPATLTPEPSLFTRFVVPTAALLAASTLILLALAQRIRNLRAA